MINKNVYSVKSYSIDAIISCVLAGISLICQIGALIISYYYEGNGPRMVGLLGIAGFMLACTGLVFCKSAWKSPDGGVSLKRIAGFANGCMVIIALAYYMLGWM